MHDSLLRDFYLVSLFFVSSYIVGGSRSLKMILNQSQLCNYFPLDGNHFLVNYTFFYFMEIHMLGRSRAGSGSRH